MTSLQKLFLSAALGWLIIAAASPAFSQQRQRRVFTNEDVGQSAPSQPAPEPPASKPETSATGPGDAANAPTAANPAVSDTTPYSELAPKERVARLNSVQRALERAREIYADRIEKETDDTLKAHWNEVSMCLLTAMRENQTILDQLQGSPPQGESTTPRQ